MMQSTNSATDTRRGRLEDPGTEGNSKHKAVHKDTSQLVVNTQKRPNPATVEPEADGPQASESVHVPNKRTKNEVTGTLASAEQSPRRSEDEQPAPAASSVPGVRIGGGFGGLASKGASGFAFGGNSTFGSGGFGSVAFAGGGTFTSSAMGANSFTTKTSKDRVDDRGSPSVASNAGSVQHPGAFTSPEDAVQAAAVPVFGATNSVFEGGDAPDPIAINGPKPLTGEEDESTIWSGKAALYQFEKSGDRARWRERGIGLLRINVGLAGRTRLIMRQANNLKLLLNALLFPELKFEPTEGLPRVSFWCTNHINQSAVEVENDAAAKKKVVSDGCEAGAALDGNEEPGSTKSSGVSGMYALKMGSMEKMDAFVQHVNSLKATMNGAREQEGAEPMERPAPGNGEIVNASDEKAGACGTLDSQPDVRKDANVEENQDDQDSGEAAAAAAAAACATDFAT